MRARPKASRGLPVAPLVLGLVLTVSGLAVVQPFRAAPLAGVSLGAVRENFLPASVSGPQRQDVDVRPRSLEIPSIGVSTPLVDLGVEEDGTLEVPSDFQRAGWLSTGPAPGENGPAVIAGHKDSYTGPAVFLRLSELEPGDEIEIRRADGSAVTFTVDDVQQVPRDRFPTASVYGPAPGPELRLITCGGAFDRTARHYLDNVVVYASLQA